MGTRGLVRMASSVAAAVLLLLAFHARGETSAKVETSPGCTGIVKAVSDAPEQERAGVLLDQFARGECKLYSQAVLHAMAVDRELPAEARLKSVSRILAPVFEGSSDCAVSFKELMHLGTSYHAEALASACPAKGKKRFVAPYLANSVPPAHVFLALAMAIEAQSGGFADSALHRLAMGVLLKPVGETKTEPTADKAATSATEETDRPAKVRFPTELAMTVTEVSGGCDEKTVQSVLGGRAAALRSCYDQALQEDANLAGVVQMKWQIVTTGRVEDVCTLIDYTKDENLLSCIRTALQTTRFKELSGHSCLVNCRFFFSCVAQGCPSETIAASKEAQDQLTAQLDDEMSEKEFEEESFDEEESVDEEPTDE